MKKYKIIPLILIIILSSLLAVYFTFLYHYKGYEKVNEWNETDIFKESDVVTINKVENEDFVILNLADIQLSDIEDFFHRKQIKKEIDYLIKEANPDLITLTGDQTWSNENLISLKSLIRWLDSYNIPFAPIFGNHDYGNEYNSSVASLNYICDLYEKSENCIFNRGPSNLGSLGNYVINIKENDKIIKTIYMLDGGYSSIITNEQIEWVKWNANGIKSINNNRYSSSMCFIHKPIDIFSKAYYAYIRGNATSEMEVLVKSSLYGIDDNGLYEIGKNIGINHYVCGHQHTNTFSINYDDTTFTFALKTGELSYYYDDGIINYNGGTVFTIKSDGSVTAKNIYVDRDEFHIKSSVNQFEEYN